MAKLEITLEKSEDDPCCKCSLEPEICDAADAATVRDSEQSTKIEISDREFIKQVKLV